LDHAVLGQVWVQLDLVHGGRNGTIAEEIIQQRHGVVGDSNRFNKARCTGVKNMKEKT
jgi:hypothetical protein